MFGSSSVKKMLFLAAAVVVFSGLGIAQTPPTKIAVINIQGAMASTKEGQKAAAALQAKFDPKRKELEAKQAEINSLQAELSKGSNTMAETKRAQLARDIDARTKALQRDSQDAQEELQLEQNKVLDELGQRMMAVIGKYATDNNLALVVDISSQQTPVLWAASGVDISKEIVDLYDKNTPPPGTTTSGGAPAGGTATPASAAPAKPVGAGAVLTPKKSAAPK
jgi:outer membrane protein